jgi:hypothetical protein
VKIGEDNHYNLLYKVFFMVNVTVDEIQRDPLKYLRQVEAGETLYY